MPKRNHHTEPNFYLKGFHSDSDEGNPKIWVYEKGKPFYEGKTEQLQNPKHRTTKVTAVERDVYSFTKEDGAKDYEKYENLLRDNFEEPAKPMLEKLRRFEMIDDGEKKVFSRYITSMKMRGNFGKQLFYNVSHRILIDEQNNLRSQGIDEKEIEKISIESVENRKKEKDGERDKKRMIELSDKSDFVCRLNWIFLLAPNSYEFMTSDNPVYWEELNSQRARLLFPIASKICLLATSQPYPKHKSWKVRENGFVEIDSAAIEGIREKIVREARFKVYFSRKAEWLVRFVNSRLN